MPHESYFKHDQPSRVDDRLARDAEYDRAWRAVCRVVDDRDTRRCRACGVRAYPDAVGLLKGHRHHLVYRSAGGTDTSENLVTLCAACHNDLHRHRLRIEGNPDEALTFWRCGGGERVWLVWYVWRREVSVGIFEKD